MPGRISTYIKFLIAVCLVISFCLVDSNAQTRRKKRSRRAAPAAPKPVITNPPIAPPDGTQTDANGDVKIISTADSTQETAQPAQQDKKPSTPAAPEPDQMQQTITTLSNQVNRLNDKLSQMQEDDRYQMDM